jgi:ABC-type bacteriocin/lantibiotic exporter with double-glycine peptidase domain
LSFVCLALVAQVRAVDRAPGRDGAESLRLDVPVVWQEKELCGAASLAMVFGYWGREISQYAIAAGIGHKPGEGLRGEDMRDFCEQAGFSAFMFRGDLDGVKDHLRKGRPVVVAIRAKTARLYHYIVLVGFDDASSVVLANDPQEGKLVRIADRKFLALWGRSKAWSLLVVPRSPGSP